MSSGPSPGGLAGSLDLRRQAAVVKGGATDHKDEVVVRYDPDFDIDTTIFKGVHGLSRYVVRRDLAVKVYWKEEAVRRISEAFGKVERPVSLQQPLLEFMSNECSFGCEHADGSFMDHLQFCYEYSAAHYQPHSPRVLLLHSILGVATNIFPMPVEKMPRLAELVTPDEMKHIGAFPTVLRLILCNELLAELTAKASSLNTLRSVRFKRVIDNQDLELTAEDFWVQLNYQMIHLLDFLPVDQWKQRAALPAAGMSCMDLYNFLVQVGRLRASVQLDHVEQNGLFARFKKRRVKDDIRKNSGMIGHSLSYALDFS